MFSLVVPEKINFLSDCLSQSYNFAYGASLNELSFQLIHTEMFVYHMPMTMSWLPNKSNIE